MKIIEVISKMIKNQDKISNVINAEGGDYFFIYDDKHKCLIKLNGKKDIDLKLFIKQELELDDLASLPNLDNISFSLFSTYDVKDDKVYNDAFKNLYNIVKYKDRDFDAEFTDILSDN